LVVDLVYIWKREILVRLLPLISRTRKLRLCCSYLFFSEGVQDICGYEAPELEHLELETSINSSVALLQLAGETLFKGRTRKLRTLSLVQVFIPWSLLPRGQLTQLRIMLYSKIPIPDPSSPVNLDQLVEFLINSPELEVVVLELCLPTVLSRSSHGQQIHLPRLSRLHLGGPTSCVKNLLKRFTIPSSASLHLRYVSENHPTNRSHLIFPLMTRGSMRLSTGSHERLGICFIAVSHSAYPQISLIKRPSSIHAFEHLCPCTK
jgi:hypothetical protein